jgi:DNA repair protein RadC
MKRINIFTLKQVKERSSLYDIDHKFIHHPKDAAQIIRDILEIHEDASERFGIITLTTKNEIAGFHVLSMGSLNASIVHPREVFKTAILNNAAAIICFHSHPSGDPTPSPEDEQITHRLNEAGELMGIKVLDHLIVCSSNYASLKENEIF